MNALPYGPPLPLSQAKKIAALALEEAVKNQWNMAIALVDSGGFLVYYEKMDLAQLGSAQVAIDKARSAVLYKRHTKAFQDSLASGHLGAKVFGLQGAIPVEGGILLVQEGKIIGAIGVSGDTSENDAKCAQAGVQSLVK